MERRLTLLLACLFLSIGMAFAQSKITGTVVSQEDGLPIIGATVMVQGTKTGTTTDMDGHFSISAPAGKKLVISYIGMDSKVVAAKSGMKVVLSPRLETPFFLFFFSGTGSYPNFPKGLHLNNLLIVK